MTPPPLCPVTACLCQVAVVNLDNELIFTDHVACAACEAALCADTAGAFFGSARAVEGALQRLRAKGVLVQADGDTRGNHRAGSWVRNPLTVTAPEPWCRVSLRAIGDQFSVVDDGRGGACIDTLDARRAFFKVMAQPASPVPGVRPATDTAPRCCLQTFEGAIYLNQGVQYLVESLDLHERVAHVRVSRADYYTMQVGQPLGGGALCRQCLAPV